VVTLVFEERRSRRFPAGLLDQPFYGWGDATNYCQAAAAALSRKALAMSNRSWVVNYIATRKNIKRARQ
jgi:hypothetical protein